jgi:hypothetical protein
MRRNQKRFIDSHQHYLLKLKNLYTPYFVAYQGAVEECELHVSDPHPKKRLREDALRELHESSEIFKPLWVKDVLYKMKKDEWAKPGKYPRMIGDLGVAASLQGFRVTDYLKIAESYESTYHNGIKSEFVKSPSQAKLRQVFSQLIQPDARGYFCYFSDDSCFSITINYRTYMYNIDISSCDSSHTTSLFQALCDITPDVAQADMRALVDQLRLPIRIVSSSNPKNKVILKT